MSRAERPVARRLTLVDVLRWLAVVLILQVLATILATYPDYFPPNFDSLFLEGRETTFAGIYRVAFYIHILTGPFVLLNGLVLLNEFLRRRHRRVHRWLGRVQVIVLLSLMLPSAMVMSRYSFAGWLSGLSFALLSAATATCAIAGVIHARRGNYDQHRHWMLRCYVLICSAVALRLISGAAALVGVESPEWAYVIAAWSSWVLPLVALEVAERMRGYN